MAARTFLCAVGAKAVAHHQLIVVVVVVVFIVVVIVVVVSQSPTTTTVSVHPSHTDALPGGSNPLPPPSCIPMLSIIL